MFVTMNYNVSESVLSLYCIYLNVIKRDCSQCANKSNHPN
jgi:hypothetical protein